MDDLKYWISFHRVPGIGRARLSLLEKHCGTLESAWKASPGQLRDAGLDRRSVTK